MELMQILLDDYKDIKNNIIVDNLIKGYSKINSPLYKNIYCSISGGSDSDIMLDIVTRLDKYKRVNYVWFDTGLEYKATKEHLDYLEEKYGVEILRESYRTYPYNLQEIWSTFLK